MKLETSETIAVVNINNKSYIVPMWLEVPVGTKLSDIEVIRPKKVDKNPILINEMVKGSKDNEYNVKIYKDGTATCECWGYKRHRKDCKHIKKLRLQI